ncbi:type IV toxin-antitoxin system AbiEi family antitoxin domain-containing protein [Nocardia puris]|uniref:type IV toxin-antitoxin system AbiEi family antitoxin domain-containing protein n=1 Tax=Nocardia puris TaxID=208602 RepID=UPI0018962A3B|nr:type IV toxin-antitoxin system AbiEi family antitoxin domain-containing protein [Nocardia puris]MBF6216158.1 type IV toxin-antitoxin system AbiEi family antitoxin domain-containing protein [Nocardia puris]
MSAVEESDLRARLSGLAESQWGLLTTAQAASTGINSRHLQRLADRGLLTRLRYGVYRLAGVPESPAEPIRAEWLALDPTRTAGDRITDQVPLGVVSHRSAADLHDLGDLDADYLEFTVPIRRGTRSPDVRFHRASLSPDDWTLVDGLPVTTPARTIGDLAAARTDGGHLASVVRDALIQGTPAEEIAEHLRPYAHRYGAPVDNGSALIDHFITQAGIPESSMALAAPSLAPLLTATEAVNQALAQITRRRAPATEHSVVPAHYAHSAASEAATALIRQAVAPLVETPQWQDAVKQIRAQLLQAADPHLFSSAAAIHELADAQVREAVTEALLEAASSTPRQTASETTK